ncbi:MAG: glycerol-3-phosphate dehydrogenase/oxidase [Planctomycetota bacterium]|jgi:glycerol-3-phosphate dehydrogenase
MNRDLPELARQSFDLAVVGGGIYGLFAARDAAQRGLSVALIDRGDFCGATSSNSLKTAHGGLRYLQTADFPRMRRSIRERRALLRIAPHLVAPLAFVMPTTRKLTRCRAALATALRLNDWISWDRNRGVVPGRHLPAGGILSRAELEDRIGGLFEVEATGGALWYDAQIANTERLALSVLHAAVDDGCCAANYVEALELLETNNRVTGIRVRDRMGGNEFEVRAPVVLDSSGPWGGSWRGVDVAPVELSKAMNLVTRIPAPTCALGSGSGGDRLFFFVPWRGFTIIGTSHLPSEEKPDALAATDADIDAFLDQVRGACRGFTIERDDVLLAHRGLLPSCGRAPNGDANLVRSYQMRDWGASGGPHGLITMLGVKWTTARAVAERAVDLVGARVGRKLASCRTGVSMLPGAHTSTDADLAREIAERLPVGDASAAQLARNFGSAYSDLAGCIGEAPGTLDDATPILRGEVLHAVRAEMALTLPDIVFRRTELGSAGAPTAAALRECANIAAKELGWDDERTEREYQNVLGRYPYPSAPNR